MKFLLFFFCFFNAQASLVEMYVYWIDEAKGKELFISDPDTSWNSLSLYQKMARRGEELGIELKSWERANQIGEVLSYKDIHSWKDFKIWFREWFRLKQKKTTIFWSFGPHLRKMHFPKNSSNRKILILYEPPVVEKESYKKEILDQFDLVLTWNDDLVDGKKWIKYYYPSLLPRIENIPSFHEKKLCTLFSTYWRSKHPQELYSARDQVIQFFENFPEEFDFYGKFWEGKGYKTWKGRAFEKLEILKNYKFNICYENSQNIRGYVTEKIFDAFAAGVVPIYWGASNITDYVPKKCFIDRREFSSNEELYSYLKEVTEERYNEYLEAAKEFLSSEKAKLFSEDYFLKILTDFVFVEFVP